MIIDAHQHFWKRSLPFQYGWLDAPHNAPIAGDFLPEDLQIHMKAAGVERTVFVQTQHDVAENRWVLGLADRHDWIAGVVGWIDLASPACEDQLREFRAHPKFVGVRHIVQDEPDDDFIIRPDVVRGLKVLERHAVPYDLLFYVKHLRHAATLAEMLPDLPMVIDHLAKPRIREHLFDDWRPAFRAAAKFPNMNCKLSGLVTEAHWNNWKSADLKPYVDEALTQFGPDRCMFGSDWPVCELAGSYEQVIDAVRDLTAQLSEVERAAIFGGTATRFYGLK